MKLLGQEYTDATIRRVIAPALISGNLWVLNATASNGVRETLLVDMQGKLPQRTLRDLVDEIEGEDVAIKLVRGRWRSASGAHGTWGKLSGTALVEVRRRIAAILRAPRGKHLGWR